MILFAGVTKRGDNMNAKRWLEGKLNPRLKRTWRSSELRRRYIFNLNICHNTPFEFMCLFCVFRTFYIFLFLFSLYFLIPRHKALKLARAKSQLC